MAVRIFMQFAYFKLTLCVREEKEFKNAQKFKLPFHGGLCFFFSDFNTKCGSHIDNAIKK